MCKKIIGAGLSMFIVIIITLIVCLEASESAIGSASTPPLAATAGMSPCRFNSEFTQNHSDFTQKHSEFTHNHSEFSTHSQ
jgi:hypothetical protein